MARIQIAFRWDLLKSLSGSPIIAKSGVGLLIVPVAAYAINIINKLMPDDLGSWSLGWNLALLFVGAVFATSANVITHLFCPAEVHRDLSREAYRKSIIHETRLSIKYNKIVDDILEKQRLQARQSAEQHGDSAIISEALARLPQAISGIKPSSEIDPAAQVAAFSDWDSIIDKKPVARFLATALYLCAIAVSIYLFFIIPFLRVFTATFPS